MMRYVKTRREGIWFDTQSRTYLYRAEGPCDLATGKRTQKMERGFPTEKKAAAARRDFLTEIVDKKRRDPTKETVREFLEAWLEATRPAGQKGLYGWRGDRYNVRAYILPRLSELPVRDLTPEAIDKMLVEIREGGRVNGNKPLSPRTVKGVRVTLGKALRYGVRKGKLLQNVVALTEPILQEKPNHRVWEAPTLRQFLDALREDRLSPLWHLASATGLRRSEIVALSWPSVDLEKGRLSVKQTMAYEGSYRVRLVELTKRDSSRRQIALDPETVAILRASRKAQAEDQLAWGPAWKNTDNLVFTREDGSPIHPELVSDWFEKLVKRLDLPRITFHELRHTYATLALQAGIPVKVVSQRLGHSSIKVTFDLYAHVIPGDDEAAAVTFSEKVLLS